MKKLLVCSLLVFASALLLEQPLSASAQPTINAASAQGPEKLSADTPKTTVLGSAFIAPKDWSIRVEGPATILEAPEGDSWVVLVDVQAKTQDEALAGAWRAITDENGRSKSPTICPTAMAGAVVASTTTRPRPMRSAE